LYGSLKEESNVKVLELWKDTALQFKGSDRRQFMAKDCQSAWLGRANFCRKELGLESLYDLQVLG